jgi:hypothetical protein
VRRALVFVMLLTACDAPVRPYESQLNVFCLLSTDDSHTIALVGRSVTFDEEGPIGPGWNGLAGATVLVAKGNDTTQFKSVPETTGYYTADSLRAVAGSSYRLLIRSQEGDEVQGASTVPGNFRIDSLSLDTVVRYEPYEYETLYAEVRVAWSPSQGASGYQLLASCLYARSEGDTVCDNQSFWGDSCRIRLWAPLRASSRHDSLCSIKLNVVALDRNYQDYLIMQREYGYRNTLMHLEGGLGVFGSMCVAETTASLVQNETGTSEANCSTLLLRFGDATVDSRRSAIPF